MTLLIAFLSLALTAVSLLVIYERRQRRGLQILLGRVLQRESARETNSQDDDTVYVGPTHSHDGHSHDGHSRLRSE